MLSNSVGNLNIKHWPSPRFQHNQCTMHHTQQRVLLRGKDFQLHVRFLSLMWCPLSVAGRYLYRTSVVSIQLAVNQTWQGLSCIPEAALYRLVV